MRIFLNSSRTARHYKESVSKKLCALSPFQWQALPAVSKALVESWRREYNQVRPHSSLGYRPPAPETVKPPSAGSITKPLTQFSTHEFSHNLWYSFWGQVSPTFLNFNSCFYSFKTPFLTLPVASS